MKYPVIFSVTFLSIFSTLFWSFPVLAQTTPETSLRLVTSPLPISLIVSPGTTATAELKVKNAGLKPENLTVTVFKFKAFEESGAPQILDPEPTDDFIRWVTFSEPAFTLDPEEWKTVTATFAVPDTASFGYYYAFVFARSDRADFAGERETVVVGGTATLVLLEARVPEAKREVTVTEFSTDRSVYEFLPVTFTVKLKNSGNVHVAPRGNIFIERGSEKDVALLELNESKGNILPASQRIFEEGWTDGFPVYLSVIEDGKALRDEAGNPINKLTWDWNETAKLRFGKYTAKMLLVYDDGTRDIPIEGVVSFWVVPWRLVLFGIAVPVIPALLVYYLMQWRMRKKMRDFVQSAKKEE